jgi:hypothetical protein
VDEEEDDEEDDEEDEEDEDMVQAPCTRDLCSAVRASKARLGIRVSLRVRHSRALPCSVDEGFERKRRSG